MQRLLIDEQIAYYRARASEYDDWWFRRGRYDRGDTQRQAWAAEIVLLETALDEARPVGTLLELACGTGIWTERLAQSATSVMAVVFFGFWLSHVPPDQFDLFWSKVQASLKPGGKAFFIGTAPLYDSGFADVLKGEPCSAWTADGSEVAVFSPRKLDK